MDDRIGTYTEDGRRVFPAFNVAGQPYNRPASTMGLDRHHFVVLALDGHDEENITALVIGLIKQQGATETDDEHEDEHEDSL